MNEARTGAICAKQCELKKPALLGTDVVRVMAGPTGASRINEDIESGLRSGVQGTPTLFINGTRHDGSWDLVPLRTALARADQH